MVVDTAFLRSRRGIVKMAEMATLLGAFWCFYFSSVPLFITMATGLEFLITSLLLLLYLFKLHQRLTFFFWPLVDICNSIVGAVYLIVLSGLALRTHTVAVILGGILCMLSAVLLALDSFSLFRRIQFNNERSRSQNKSDSEQSE